MAFHPTQVLDFAFCPHWVRHRWWRVGHGAQRSAGRVRSRNRAPTRRSQEHLAVAMDCCFSLWTVPVPSPTLLATFRMPMPSARRPLGLRELLGLGAWPPQAAAHDATAPGDVLAVLGKL